MSAMDWLDLNHRRRATLDDSVMSSDEFNDLFPPPVESMKGKPPRRPMSGVVDTEWTDEITNSYFRPRSSSDSRAKKPVLKVTSPRGVNVNVNGPVSPLALNGNSNSPSEPDRKLLYTKNESSSGRPRAGSDSAHKKRGPVMNFVDKFRARSSSLTVDSRKRHNSSPAGDQKLVLGYNRPNSPQSIGFVVRRQESLSKDRPKHIRSLSEEYTNLKAATSASPNGNRLSTESQSDVFETLKIQDFTDEDIDKVYSRFLQAHTCYDLVPISSKLVVFDTSLHVKKAFFALVYNGVRAAPLWDNTAQDFIGMLTITDFIRILHKYYKAPLEKIAEVEEHKIQTWRQKLPNSMRSLVSIDVEESLYDAVRLLSEMTVHRLPVIDRSNGNCLHILTHKRILRFLYLYMQDLPEPSFMEKTLEELGVGTFENIATATYDTTVIEALQKFVERRVSALPVVDADGRVIDVYAKFDVINLAAEKTYSNLDVTIREALDRRMSKQEGVHTCQKTDPFKHIIETIVKAEVHRLIIVDKDGLLRGILSLSDILRQLILKPMDEEETKKDISDEQSFVMDIDEIADEVEEMQVC